MHGQWRKEKFSNFVFEFHFALPYLMKITFLREKGCTGRKGNKTQSKHISFFLFKLKIDSTLIQYITTKPQFPLHPLLPGPCPPTHLPWIYSSSVLFQKRAGLPETATKHDKKMHKTRQNPSHQDWTRQLNKRKTIPTAGRVKDTLAPRSESHRNTKLTGTWYMQRT